MVKAHKFMSFILVIHTYKFGFFTMLYFVGIFGRELVF